RRRLDALELGGVDMIDRSHSSCTRRGDTVDFAYARFNKLSVDRQGNYFPDIRCGPTVDAQMPLGTVLTRQHDVMFHAYLPTDRVSSVTKCLEANAQRFTNVPESRDGGNQIRDWRDRPRDNQIRQQRGAMPPPRWAGWLLPPVAGHALLPRDNRMSRAYWG